MRGDVRVRVALLAALGVAAVAGYRAWSPEAPASDMSAVPEGRPDTKWVWENPAPLGEPWIRGGWVFGKRDAWVVGEHGTVLRYDGEWSRVPTTTDATLWSAWSPRSGEVWTVGADCTLVRLKGRTATEQKIEGCDARDLFGIWGNGPSDVWVVGGRGFTSHFDGSAWTRSDVPARHLWSVWTAGKDDAWAIGDGVFRWNGKAWSKLDVPGVPSGSALWGSGPKDVWLVGSTELRRWNGSTWSKEEPRSVYDVWGTGPSDVWITQHGQIGHFDGRAWTYTARPETNLGAVHGAGGEVWAFGARDVLRKDGDAWQALATNVAPYNFLQAVHGTSRKDIWAVGDRGVLHRDGRGWSAMACDGCSAGRGVWAASPREAWIVGHKGTILRWDGSTWRRETSDTDETLTGVWGSSASDIWAVGEHGVVLHRDGSGWKSAPKLPALVLSSVWGTGPKDVWASGSKVFHWDGSSWKEIPTTSERYPGGKGLWGFGRDDVWLGGVEGVAGKDLTSVQRWNGSRFSAEGAPFATRALWGPSSGDIWALGGPTGLGGKGLVRHLARGRWTTIDGLLEQRMMGIWGDDRSMWIVGENGTILRRDL